jgi:hypothetical protein
MKIGLQIPRFTWPGGNAGIAAKFAEIEKTTLGTAHLVLRTDDVLRNY